MSVAILVEIPRNQKKKKIQELLKQKMICNFMTYKSFVSNWKVLSKDLK